MSAPASEWPSVGGATRVIFVLEAASGLERRLLEEWIDRSRPADFARERIETVTIPSLRRKRRAGLDPRLESALASGDDPLLAPLRIAWSAGGNGAQRVRLRKLLTVGDPRDPGRLRQSLALRRDPGCYRVVVAEPARLGELRARWRDAGGTNPSETIGLAEFVARQAGLALERAERRLRGARYKVPRFVYEDILSRPGFRGGIARLARELGRNDAEVGREAAKYLREIAATHSPYVIDLVANLIRLLYTQAYGERLHYDRDELARIYSLTQRHPVVFLPTHKSNFDHLVLQYMLHENGHPPNHTAGGINMNFFPIGPLVRRSGTFFIRRTFKDNEVYKFVLRSYIDYLIEKRFSLEWYIEGGRSRSGKLLPPRFGMLAYVVDAYERGKSDDVMLIPVSIAYDQIQDVGDYVAEQRGAAKQKESFSWFVKLVRGLRSRSGNIHIRLGEPLSLRAALGPPNPLASSETDERDLEVAKLAFEVAVRINRATPITPTSLVTLGLLGFGERAADAEEVAQALKNLVSYVRRKSLPTTVELDLDRREGVERALAALVESGVVFRFAEGLEPVYAIRPDQALTAAYYRNTIIHFFVVGSIAELACLRACEDGVRNAVDEFWEEALRLRDLLKFEFFFAEKEKFRAELAEEMRLHDPDWEAKLTSGGAAIHGLVRSIRPFNSHRVLRPFLEAYRVVGDALERSDSGKKVDETELLTTCMNLGRQLHLQRRIRSAESVSRVLFANALKLAANRRLLEPSEDVAACRAAFADELREAIRRVDAIDALAASRRAGLID